MFSAVNSQYRSQQSHVISIAEKCIPWLLPALLLFSRALADITVVVVGLLFLYKSYIEKNWSWQSNTWFRLSIVFFLYLLFVNSPLSINSTDSLKYSVFFMRWPLFAAALAYWLLLDIERQKHFLKGLALVSAFVIFDTVWQYIYGIDLFGIPQHSADRLTGPFRGPVPGTLMLRVLFLLVLAALVFKVLNQSSLRTISYVFAVLIIGLLFIFITGERMAFLLFSMGTILILIGLSLNYRQSKRVVLSFILLTALILSVSMCFLPNTYDRTIHSVFIKLNDFSSSDYGVVFKAAKQTWLESPIWGSGLHTYREACESLAVLDTHNMQCTHPHNLYLHLSAETGVIGLVLYLMLLGAILVSSLRPLIIKKEWFLSAVSLAIFFASFWPLTGGISVFSNWIGALAWLGVGWILLLGNQCRVKPTTE